MPVINKPDVCEYCGEPVEQKRDNMLRNGFGYSVKHAHCSMDTFPITGLQFFRLGVIA